MTEILLSTHLLCKQFGGLDAVKDVSIDLCRNQIHAVIGPNGAGKSTLAHLLSGEHQPSSGSMVLLGRDITGWSPDKISHQGLSRSYQTSNIFPTFTVWENIRLASQSRAKQPPWHARTWLQTAAKASAINERANRALEQCGLQFRKNSIAGTISHGEQRQLEVAMTLATEPQVLILDEPLAGMGVAEAQTMVSLLLKLKQGHALLLVEHDMDAVFTLADHLTVMVNGQVVASDKPLVVRSDARVQAAYLGEAMA
ncbi:MAG: ABC transporter ATP-binding protein [Burkholderiaceae bacterium]